MNGLGPLTARAEQYTALSDGIKRQYTDEDAIPEYGGGKILDPADVSYYNLYVNAVLQPPVNYHVTRGLLEFTTNELPPSGVPIVLEFITLYDGGAPVRASSRYFVARAAVSQRVLRNTDALPELSTGGIPSPQSVSFMRLFVNGVLQSPEVYAVQQGLLVLRTQDSPKEGCYVVLQSVSVGTDGYHQAITDLMTASALQAAASAMLLHAVGSAISARYTQESFLPLNQSSIRLLEAVTQLSQTQYIG